MPKAGRFRPFIISAGIRSHSYSLPLQRALTDFGAEPAFCRVNEKMKEHYGIVLPTQAARAITLRHAEIIEQQQAKEIGQIKNSPKDIIISQTDGSMVPIVSINEGSKDKRKGKKVPYREARLTLAHEQGVVNPTFSATLGDVAEAGQHISHCIHKVGVGDKTEIHAVGDGAVWILEQIEAKFGKQATYLIDLFHVCEYLSAAAPACRKTLSEKEWVEKQKSLLKENHATTVLSNLLPYRESPQTAEENAPVRSCHRYLQNRLHQLDYKSAIEKGLPIGSGEIESAHRYVIQTRMKIQGAWWLEKTAKRMLALRTKQANNEWANHWDKLAA